VKKKPFHDNFLVPRFSCKKPSSVEDKGLYKKNIGGEVLGTTYCVGNWAEILRKT